MRLNPLDRPRSLLVRLGFAASRRRYGQVLPPLSVLYARLPRLLRPQLGLLRLAGAGLTLDRRLARLLEIHVSQLNGCSFCGDLHRFEARRDGVTAELLAELPRHDVSDRFPPSERAALAFAEALVRDRRADDALWDAVRAHHDDRAVAEIVWLVAFVGYLNHLATALELPSAGLCALPSAASPPDALVRGRA